MLHRQCKEQISLVVLIIILFFTLPSVVKAVIRLHEGHMICRLAKLDDIRVVGPLVEALRLTNKRILIECVSALTRLLPLLKTADAYLLHEYQRRFLHRIMTDPSYESVNPEFLLAILKAFEQVGDQGDILYVHELAKSTSNSQIREAAEACLSLIIERSRRHHSSKTLVRPSSNDHKITLLSPSQSAEGIISEQLLRPNCQEEQDNELY